MFNAGVKKVGERIVVEISSPVGSINSAVVVNGITNVNGKAKITATMGDLEGNYTVYCSVSSDTLLILKFTVVSEDEYIEKLLSSIINKVHIARDNLLPLLKLSPSSQRSYRNEDGEVRNSHRVIQTAKENSDVMSDLDKIAKAVKKLAVLWDELN